MSGPSGSIVPGMPGTAVRPRSHRVRPWVALLLAVLGTQAIFTAAVRLYVVPKLTPHVHWHSGLQFATDSEYFHNQAIKFSAQLRQRGWRALGEELDPGLIHVKILASLYYLVGRDTPYVVYAVNVFVAGLTALLLYALARSLRLRPWPAAAAAGLLTTGPMFLFAHSELVREPFIIPSFQTFVLGVLLLIRQRPGRPRGETVLSQVGGALVYSVGFVAVSSFRPYLMLPMLLALGIIFATRFALGLANRERIDVPQIAIIAASLLVLTTGFVIPQMGRVTDYAGRAASAEEALQAAVPAEEAKRQLRKKIDAFTQRPSATTRDAANPALDDAPGLTHDDIILPTVCTVKWRNTPYLPAALDRKGEALACAREGHLLFCNPEVMGSRADRRCDETNFSSLGDVVRHLPASVMWSLFVPYPNMWLDGFGSGGSGLRRLGYVVDGLVSYALLPGLLGLVWHWRTRPDVLAVSAGLVTLLVIYGLGVPTQFILARMRLSMYLPLLLMAFAGWAAILRRDRPVA